MINKFIICVKNSASQYILSNSSQQPVAVTRPPVAERDVVQSLPPPRPMSPDNEEDDEEDEDEEDESSGKGDLLDI